MQRAPAPAAAINMLHAAMMPPKAIRFANGYNGWSSASLRCRSHHINAAALPAQPVAAPPYMASDTAPLGDVGEFTASCTQY
jgi:hypothetical protein